MTPETLNSVANWGEAIVSLTTSIFLVARIALRVWPDPKDSDLLAFGQALLAEIALVHKQPPVVVVHTPDVSQPIVATPIPQAVAQSTLK